MSKTTIEKLWEEKLLYDQHPENSVLQSKEWDSIANSILYTAKLESISTELEIQAVDWAKKRLGV